MLLVINDIYLGIGKIAAMGEMGGESVLHIQGTRFITHGLSDPEALPDMNYHISGSQK